MKQLSFVSKQGNDIMEFAVDFAQLRIAVFYDFPYLYEGSLEYEMQYIKTYAQCPEAFVLAVYDDDKMVGATTCIPLEFETPNVKQPLINAGFNIKDCCYFGESILLSPYRGMGIGHRFFDERESYAQRLGLKTTLFCAVERPDNHILKPKDYRPNDVFWNKRKYVRQEHLSCNMDWLDRGETQETTKQLTFWIKK